MKKKHVVVLGAGISGLALAWHLKKNFPEDIHLTTIEKSARAGGWIRTIQKQGFLFEEGPRSCRTQGAGAATLQLIEELGLENEVIPASSQATKRYLYIDKQLQCMPQGLISLLFSPLTRDILPTLSSEWRRMPGKCEDESVYDFFARRCSPQFAERFIDPLVAGIYAGDMRQLSLRSCFSQLYHWEQVYGSLTKGMFFDRSHRKEIDTHFVKMMKKAPLFSFKQGMETLIKTLSNKLREHIQFNSCAAALKVMPDYIEVALDDGQILKAQHLFLAMPEDATLSLLRDSFPSMNIPRAETSTSSVAVVNIGWVHPVLNRSGFGYLIPSSEREKILGVVWDSSVFPQQNGSKNETRLTVMMGGTHHPEIVQLPDDILQKYALDAIKQQLKIDVPPQAVHVHVAKHAIPQYALGHSSKLKKLEESLAVMSNRLTLHGSAWYGVSVNDCILNSRERSLSLTKF